MKKQTKADLMLVFVTLCWGVSYYLIDICVAEMGPFGLNAFRFITAFSIAFVLAFQKVRNVNKTTLRYSVYVGIALAVTYAGATFGVMYTSLSNAGFLCALAVVFTPLFGGILYRKLPEKKLIAVVAMCILGIALMTLNKQLRPALGDFFCIICAIAYAFDLLIIERAVKREDVNAFQLGVYQLAWVGVLNLVFHFIFETPQLPGSASTWFALFFLSIFCTGLAFIVQTIAQQYTSASHVGVIFTLEPVFAGIVAFVWAGEILLPRAYVGAVILLLGILIMETDIKKLLSKWKKKNEDLLE